MRGLRKYHDTKLFLKPRRPVSLPQEKAYFIKYFLKQLLNIYLDKNIYNFTPSGRFQNINTVTSPLPREKKLFSSKTEIHSFFSSLRRSSNYTNRHLKHFPLSYIYIIYIYNSFTNKGNNFYAQIKLGEVKHKHSAFRKAGAGLAEQVRETRNSESEIKLP